MDANRARKYRRTLGCGQELRFTTCINRTLLGFSLPCWESYVGWGSVGMSLHIQNSAYGCELGVNAAVANTHRTSVAPSLILVINLWLFACLRRCASAGVNPAYQDCPVKAYLMLIPHVPLTTLESDHVVHTHTTRSPGYYKFNLRRLL